MKHLYIHVGNKSWKFRVHDEDEFNKEVDSLTNVLTKDGSCWIPVYPDNNTGSECHIFLTEEMKKRTVLECVVE